jgi:choline-sulfatase
VKPAFGLRLSAFGLVAVLGLAACTSNARPPANQPAAPARNLVLLTIDTMRADHVGAYGYPRARTPAMDRLAQEGARFDRAFASAPITLTSHASLLTGLYPPGHGARHNGVAMRGDIPTLATSLRDQGFATGAFVAAFPLDRRFGLARGFDVYGDRMPRGQDGRLANERRANVVIDEAVAWLGTVRAAKRFFLWVHLFEPHAPYGDPATDGRPAIDRYDAEITAADAALSRLLSSLGPDLDHTLVVVASDHGEAFGEHGEIGHSLFVYDTTLRVALILRGPGVPPRRIVPDSVGLIDVAPTVTRLLGTGSLDADGIDLRPALEGKALPHRALYAETFAPLLDFGWSPLRALRDGRLKAIAAPRPELYDLAADPAERTDLGSGLQGEQDPHVVDLAPMLAAMLKAVDRISGPDLPSQDPNTAPRDAAARLGALGYVQGGAAPAGRRPDPKDRREMAARISAVTSGELQGDALLASLRALVTEDPRNGQMQLRLGDALLQRGQTKEAERYFKAAIEARLPSADPYLGLAACQAQAGVVAGAIGTLERSQHVEADNPVVLSSLGLLYAQAGRFEPAAAALRQALAIDPEFHEARFNLARVLGRAGRRDEALAEATTLLSRLPANSPQRPEVERLVGALR